MPGPTDETTAYTRNTRRVAVPAVHHDSPTNEKTHDRESLLHPYSTQSSPQVEGTVDLDIEHQNAANAQLSNASSPVTPLPTFQCFVSFGDEIDRLRYEPGSCPDYPADTRYFATFLISRRPARPAVPYPAFQHQTSASPSTQSSYTAALTTIPHRGSPEGHHEATSSMDNPSRYGHGAYDVWEASSASRSSPHSRNSTHTDQRLGPAGWDWDGSGTSGAYAGRHSRGGESESGVERGMNNNRHG